MHLIGTYVMDSAIEQLIVECVEFLLHPTRKDVLPQRADAVAYRAIVKDTNGHRKALSLPSTYSCHIVEAIVSNARPNQLWIAAHSPAEQWNIFDHIAKGKRAIHMQFPGPGGRMQLDPLWYWNNS